MAATGNDKYLGVTISPEELEARLKDAYKESSVDMRMSKESDKEFNLVVVGHHGVN